jgi:hypothetical protein
MVRPLSFKRSRVALLVLGGALAMAGMLATAPVRAQEHFDRGHGPERPERADRGAGRYDPAHDHFDRFNHAHFYPNRGSVVHALPPQHYDVAFGGAHYYFAGGVWYAPRGGLFVVVAPPFGLFVPVLPPFYTTVWVAGAPYYYADDVYYVYRGPAAGYEVVAPPPGEEVAAAQPGPPPGAGPGPAHQLYIYPRNGQTPDQQARDQYDCHTWAQSQSGFDPTAPNGGVPPLQEPGARANYDRAMAACLEGRGYTVK